MKKERFLEDASKWIWNLTMPKYPYDGGDNYWFGIVMMFLGLILLVTTYWLCHSIIYGWIDKKTGVLTEYNGTLIDKKYIGESDSSGSGTALVNTTGGVGVGFVSTRSHSPEEFLFFIRANEVYKCEVDMQKYYHFKVGDSIRFSTLIGGKSGDILKTKLI